ncbi:MAG: hypothetical protein EOO65_05705 [Methanosarcinales archaeon]|nr:MAG: hypothetical protein EOO65_05705 [Methanosarcinales archaeon]
MLERYFEQPEEVKSVDVRKELHYQVCACVGPACATLCVGCCISPPNPLHVGLPTQLARVHGPAKASPAPASRGCGRLSCGRTYAGGGPLRARPSVAYLCASCIFLVV